MAHSDDQTRLHHMLEHALEAMEMVDGRQREDLYADRQLGLAVVRLLEIVGEAANRVSKQRQERETDIPWADVIGMRNRLVHGYEEVDLDIVWEIVTDDLPPLVKSLERALA